MKIQEMINIFNADYFTASNSSKPEDWLQAALMARQLVVTMAGAGLVEDNFSDLQSYAKAMEDLE